MKIKITSFGYSDGTNIKQIVLIKQVVLNSFCVYFSLKNINTCLIATYVMYFL